MTFVFCGHLRAEMRAGEGGTLGLHGAAEGVQAAEDTLHVLFCEL